MSKIYNCNINVMDQLVVQMDNSTSRGMLSQWCSLDSQWSSLLMIMSIVGCCRLLTGRGRWSRLISMITTARC